LFFIWTYDGRLNHGANKFQAASAKLYFVRRWSVDSFMQRQRGHIWLQSQFLFTMFSAVRILSCIVSQAKNLVLASEAAFQITGAGKKVMLP
jgi:hypothetical protein